MTISLYDRVENAGDKEKMLVISIFSFSHSVFQSTLFFLSYFKSGLYGKGLAWAKVA